MDARESFPPLHFSPKAHSCEKRIIVNTVISYINLVYNKRTLQAPPTKYYVQISQRNFMNRLSPTDICIKPSGFQRPLVLAVATTVNLV